MKVSYPFLIQTFTYQISPYAYLPKLDGLTTKCQSTCWN